MTSREKAELLGGLLKVMFAVVGHQPDFDDFDYLVEEGGLATGQSVTSSSPKPHHPHLILIILT